MERYFNREFESALDDLEKRLRATGHTLTDLCDANHCSRATLVRWKKHPPMTIRIIVELQKTVERWEAEKATGIPGEDD